MRLTLNSSDHIGELNLAFVIVPRFNLATLLTMLETLRIGNSQRANNPFAWQITSFDGDEIPASNGVSVQVDVSPDGVRRADYVFIFGSWGAEHYQNRNLTKWLRRRERLGETICAVELGCYVLGNAGLLDGKKATTHWSWIDGFRENFDQIETVEQLFTIDSKSITCAGGTTGIDLMLRLVSDNFDASFVDEIADQMLYHPIREETTSQRPNAGRDTQNMPSMVQKAISIIERNIEEPLKVPEIAETLGISQRQLERRFLKHLGCTIVQFGLLRRLQNARVLLISTDLSVREIATATGFNTLSHFSHSFNKFFGRRPSDYRESWPSDQNAPTWPGTLADFLGQLSNPD